MISQVWNHLRKSRAIRSTATTATAMILLGGGSACTSPDRSRSLGNENLSATAIATQVCSTCHGAKGNSVSPAFPNLAGQTQEYLVLQLSAFRSHRRSDPKGHEYMWGMASPLSNLQITDLAAYYAGQRPIPARLSDDFKLKAGQAIVEHGDPANSVPACIACHGTHAEGNRQFPRLAGQHADYLVKQLKIFQNTDGRPDGVVMKGVTHAMTDESMVDVAAYLEAMHAP